jgi:hypothetical protein
VLPNVWLAYGEEPEAPHELLLTPHADTTAAELAASVVGALGEEGAERTRLAYNEAYVVLSATLHELIQRLLPLSTWWHERLAGGSPRRSAPRELLRAAGPAESGRRRASPDAELAWLVGVIGCIVAGRDWADGDPADSERRKATILGAGWQVLAGALTPRAPRHTPLWRVNINRQAQTTVWRSAMAIKADAVLRLFDVSCAKLRWAIIDTGVDATHPAFRRRTATGALVTNPFAGAPPARGTRVVATYDFTRLRDLLSGPQPPRASKRAQAALADLRSRIRTGRAIDWDSVAPLLEVRHGARYRAPQHDHGTHVAGILAADWRPSDPAMPVASPIRGICPDIELYDLRVLGPDGRGDEYAISAALQFVRHLNSHSDLQVIHGVNLSLALAVDVSNYATGRTPICDECERLVGSGVTVVVAAGNDGQADFTSGATTASGFRSISITDPGNAESVITVGATHRSQPHTYGVSYFSSRGPTGDGRLKPDLVAPGEKIAAPVPGADFKWKDGTSQAAPHVSGTAALLMARNEELVGQPRRIKEILMESATDLGREPYFQGAGLVDALRAMQSV